MHRKFAIGPLQKVTFKSYCHIKDSIVGCCKAKSKFSFHPDVCTTMYIIYDLHLIQVEKLGCDVLNTAMLGTKMEPTAMPCILSI